MRNLKKILALVLALMMALSVMVFASANVIEDYTDDASISAEYSEAVEVLTGMGIFQGSEDQFYPTSNVKRSEIAALMYRIMSKDTDDSGVGTYVGYTQFDDVTAANWFAGHVGYAAYFNLVKGSGNNYYPDGSITGYEMVTILLRAIGYDQNGEIAGEDWTADASTQAQRLGMLDNLENVVLSNALTREQVAQLIFNAITLPKLTYTPAFGYQTTTAGVANSSIAWDNFRLASDASNDEYGRPTTEWFKADSTVTGDPNVDSSVVVTYPTQSAASYATIEAVPVATYYTEVTECDVAEDVNNGKDIATYTSYTNGGTATTVGTATTDPGIDATETVAVIGDQGRTTEIYKVGTSWVVVYVDTYLAKVEAVIPAVTDTAGHEISPASVTLNVGAVTGSTTATGTSVTDVVADGYVVGDYVLFTQHTGATVTATSGPEIDVVSKANTATGTVTGIHSTGTGVAATNDGVVVNGTTYLANNTYTTGATELQTLANTMINKTYTLYLDGQNNLIGMVEQTAAAGVGVVTAMQAVSVGTGKWAVQADLTLVDGTTTTLQFANNTSAGNGTSVETGTPTLGADSSVAVTGLVVGNLVEFKPATVSNIACNIVVGYVDTAKITGATGASLETGVTDTISGITVDDDTVFVVANYAYDYSIAQTVLQGYSVYNGFKTVPTLTGTTNYGELTALDGTQYILLDSSTGAESAYVQSNKVTQTVDTSALIISKGTTYQYYSVYHAVVNGQLTTVNVSNSVQGVFTTAGNGYGKLYTLTGLNTSGYYNGAAPAVDANSVASNIAANSAVSYKAGVLTYNTSTYKTVADDCLVYIVNTVRGNGEIYAATLDNITTYTNAAMSYELDEYGYISHLYIIDQNVTAPAAP